MPTSIKVTSSNTLSELQEAVDNYDIVEFTGGQVFTLTGYISVRNPTVLTTPISNPATIKRQVETNRCILINGSYITIKNLIFDFNTADGWEDFAACITFNMPSGDLQQQNVLSNNKLINLTFIDSFDSVHSTNGDSWGIVFTNDASDGVQETLVTGCRVTANDRQLTAGGAGGGVTDCEISHNYIKNGRSNPIAVSNRFNDGSEDDDIISNIHIHHNSLIGNHSTGVFVGRDGNDDPNINVSLSNILIENNLLQLRSGSAPFAKGVLIKSGNSAASTWSGVTIKNNQIICGTSESTTTRLIDIKGPSASGEVIIKNNRSLGIATHNIDNLSIIQSGNTLNNSSLTFLGDI